ncbi:MAG: glycerol-3-phosphate dehydrogenase [Verrucomicrobiales bacterium]|jgi:glycerol-3-phosphate dehydrogenase (NAD(P)+)|nr:glycerol-3-phosphate dehydrogenase [Verrucomicrobiales bacterium]|tara:strand:- start:37336 stop:38334 length:999 start_codon:yes stop_codon:yes gene_type:complete
MIQNAAVLGAGSWGTALAIALADRELDVVLYGNEQNVCDEINQSHSNKRYLPGVELPSNIKGSLDIAEAASREIILLVVPSQVARLVLKKLADAGPSRETIIVSCTKGLDPETGELMHELIAEFFPENPIAVLSGPSHAEEVASRMATLATIGSEDSAVAARVQEVFTLPWFRTYTSDDIVGIELGSVVKNIFAIAAGAADGLGLGDNAKAALVTRGLAEMTRLGVAIGGKEETFRGLSGIGDLIVTCYSLHSRNNRVGRMLGSGMTLAEAVAEMDQVAEGVPNAMNAHELSRKLGVRTPIIDQTYAVIHENKPPGQALRELLERNPRSEKE